MATPIKLGYEATPFNVNMYKGILDEREGQYNAAMEGIQAAQDKYSTVVTSSADANDKNMLIDQFAKKTQETLGKYAGNAAAASQELRGDYQKLMQNPFWNQSQYKLAKQDEFEKEKVKLGAKGVVFKDPKDITVIDPETGKVRSNEAFQGIAWNIDDLKAQTYGTMDNLKSRLEQHDPVLMKQVEGLMSSTTYRGIEDLSQREEAVLRDLMKSNAYAIDGFEEHDKKRLASGQKPLADTFIDDRLASLHQGYVKDFIGIPGWKPEDTTDAGGVDIQNTPEVITEKVKESNENITKLVKLKSDLAKYDSTLKVLNDPKSTFEQKQKIVRETFNGDPEVVNSKDNQLYFTQQRLDHIKEDYKNHILGLINSNKGAIYLKDNPIEGVSDEALAMFSANQEARKSIKTKDIYSPVGEAEGLRKSVESQLLNARKANRLKNLENDKHPIMIKKAGSEEWKVADDFGGWFSSDKGVPLEQDIIGNPSYTPDNGGAMIISTKSKGDVLIPISKYADEGAKKLSDELTKTYELEEGSETPKFNRDGIANETVIPTKNGNVVIRAVKPTKAESLKIMNELGSNSESNPNKNYVKSPSVVFKAYVNGNQIPLTFDEDGDYDPNRLRNFMAQKFIEANVLYSNVKVNPEKQ